MVRSLHPENESAQPAASSEAPRKMVGEIGIGMDTGGFSTHPERGLLAALDRTARCFASRRRKKPYERCPAKRRIDRERSAVAVSIRPVPGDAGPTRAVLCRVPARRWTPGIPPAASGKLPSSPPGRGFPNLQMAQVAAPFPHPVPDSIRHARRGFARRGGSAGGAGFARKEFARENFPAGFAAHRAQVRDIFSSLRCSRVRATT